MKARDPRDVPVSKTCPDCGAPVWDDMIPKQDCWYWGQLRVKLYKEGRGEEFDDIQRSGADSPCAGNHYNYTMDRMAAERRLNFFIGLSLVVVVVGLLLWYFA